MWTEDLFATHKYDGHQRKRNDGHCCAYREVDAEVDISYYQICDQQQTDSHCRGYQIMMSDVCAFAEDAAEIRYSERYETDWAAD